RVQSAPTPQTGATRRGRRRRNGFLVIEQLPGTDKAHGCGHNKGNSEKDEGEPVVTAKRPRQPLQLQSTSRIKRVRICHREHKQVELLNDEPECYHGDAGAHPSEKRSLVGRMITVAADHETPHRSSETPYDECPPISAPRANLSVPGAWGP